IIIAAESAKFGQPEIKIGIMPGAGGTQRLIRAVGKFKAMKLMLTGAVIDAREADRIGLVTEVVPDAELMERARALAVEIAGLPPVALAEILRNSLEMVAYRAGGSGTVLDVAGAPADLSVL
ncbi:enoyl-CoA hydratase-related protein, partial [Escherichia coli]|uniref:enoyl-CoA hydratase-related protein n=1 Tax=Escherichia coli TaxID=562 RepID=UPI001952F624